MRPRSIGLKPSLSPDTKLRQVQQNTDMLVQISGRTHPHIADNLPMPKACKEVFHPCAIEAMHIIIFLLVVTQFLTTNKWNGSMDAALVGAMIQGGPQQRGQNQKWLPHPCPQGPKRGWKCYVTPTFSGVPNKGDKIRSGYLIPAFSGVTSKIWHIPNAQAALKTQLWNNKLVEKGQN